MGLIFFLLSTNFAVFALLRVFNFQQGSEICPFLALCIFLDDDAMMLPTLSLFSRV